MSVINQMLKDLDKRQAQAPARARAPVNRRGSNRLMWIALVAAVLIFLVFGLPQYQKKPPRIIDTPGHKEPKVIVLRPGEPTSTPSAAGTASTAAQQSTGTATSNVAVQSTVATSNSPSAAAQTSSTQLAATPAAEPHSVAAHPAVVNQPAVNSPTATAQQSLPVSLTPVLLPAAEIASGNAATLPETLDVATLDPSQSFPALPASTRTTPAVQAPVPQLKIERVGPASKVPSSLLQQANDALQAGNWPLAAQLWSQLQRQEPSQARAYEQLVSIYSAQQNTTQLSAVLELARQQGVSSVRLQLAQLRLLANTQQWQPLLDACTPELEQQGGGVLSLKAQAQQQLGLLDAAVRTYQQWQQLEPHQARAFLGEAIVQEQQGHPAAARQAYQQALQRGGLAADTVTFIQQRLQQGAQP